MKTCIRILLLAWLFAANLAAAQGLLPMWEVSGPKGKVYLLGSVHVCRPNCYPLPAVIQKRFEAAKQLAVELDPAKPETVAKVMQAARLAPGESFIEELSAEDRRQLDAAMARVGLPENATGGLRPWMVNVLLALAAAQKSGFSSQHGVDGWLMEQARRQGKRVLEMETADEQIAAITSGGNAFHLQALRETLQMINDGKHLDYFKTMVQAWREGDTLMLEALITEAAGSGSEAWMKELLDVRNVRMATRVDGWLQRGESVFVVAGAGHMIGEKGLPALLAAKGYAVRQMGEND